MKKTEMIAGREVSGLVAIWNRSMERWPAWMGILAVVLLAGLLLLLGDLLIAQRELNGPTPEMTISGDTLVYTKMIEDGIDTAREPFKYRVLVPLIGGALPFSPTLALKVITYVSLFFAYLFALLACRRLGISLLASFLGLFALYTSVWHLYNYHNPYLTDAFQLLALAVMFYALASTQST